ncbi:hypothetical protein J437_LFUL010228 [Ladona fulva]|uniref:Uncharacterized protein n=1 Tax=Ladona fulva TaxID=123851 RepID=A0A8K0KAY5_LADFU|nr:hypothetical protein J437_LFUL010228 [Ladona fulva]
MVIESRCTGNISEINFESAYLGRRGRSNPSGRPGRPNPSRREVGGSGRGRGVAPHPRRWEGVRPIASRYPSSAPPRWHLPPFRRPSCPPPPQLPPPPPPALPPPLLHLHPPPAISPPPRLPRTLRGIHPPDPEDRPLGHRPGAMRCLPLPRPPLGIDLKRDGANDGWLSVVVTESRSRRLFVSLILDEGNTYAFVSESALLSRPGNVGRRGR